MSRENFGLFGGRAGYHSLPDSRPRSSILRLSAVLTVAGLALFGCGMVWNTRPQIDNTSSAETIVLDLDPNDVVIADEAYPGLGDEILNLPGIPEDYTAKQFSGYLDIDGDKRIHYWLCESQSNPATDPVVIWMNGGPGASSLSGLVYENGPLLINPDGETLRYNKFGWNRKASMLYLESPVGVGFSYSRKGNYVSGDLLQAKDNLQAVLRFFEKFPHLRHNKLIITGESYGGIYVPTLAKEIVQHNEAAANPEDRLNLETFAVGNGVNEFGQNSLFFYAYYHGLLGKAQYEGVRRDCPEIQEFKKTSMTPPTADCAATAREVLAQLWTAHLNSYDIYRACWGGSPFAGIQNKDVGKDYASIPHPEGIPIGMCLNMTAGATYFNTPSVRKAIHIEEHFGTWHSVSITNSSMNEETRRALHLENATFLNYGMTLRNEVVPMWKYLLDHGVRGVIYHGDADAVCNFLGGQWAVESLQLPLVAEWQPWHTSHSSQAAGFVKGFQNISFVTVRGAGHMVPQWKPAAAQRMFERFILDMPPEELI